MSDLSQGLNVVPKSRIEIEAEKAGKPRVDLIPAIALAEIMDAARDIADECPSREPHELLFLAASELAYGASVRQPRPLARAWVFVALSMHPNETVAIAVGRGLLAAGKVMALGLIKHGKCTWRVAGTEQASPQCHYASACRHMAEALAGLEADPDSGRPPAVHILTQIPILIDLLVDPPEIAGENDGHAMLPEPPVPIAPPAPRYSEGYINGEGQLP